MNALKRQITKSSVAAVISLVAAVGTTPTADAQAQTARSARKGAAAIELIDIGTLRGGRNSRAVALNASGDIAGDAETAQGTTHAFRWTNGPIRDLGTLGGAESHAVAINDAGDIVGSAQTASSQWRAVLWPAHGQIKDLGTLGGTFSEASDLNNDRVIVGTAERADGSRIAFRWTQQGGMQDLGTLGGGQSSARSINSGGQVAGSSEIATGTMRAFIWSPGTGMRDLGTLGGRYSAGVSINTAGQVAGYSQYDPDPETPAPFAQAFRWSADEGMRAVAPGNQSAAVAINDAGDVAGWAQEGSPYTGVVTGFLWRPSGPVALEDACRQDIYPCGSTATDINPDGMVTGGTIVPTGLYMSNEFAVRWTGDGQVEYLPSVGGVRSLGLAINRSGWVAGEYQTAGGDVHAVLWR